MNRFDIAPFALPNAPAGELKFEEMRDIESVDVDFAGPAPATAALQYLRKNWPGESTPGGWTKRIERVMEMVQQRPMSVGWYKMDDLFTPEWVTAATNVARRGKHTLVFSFQALTAELPDATDYAVTFRRTVGVRVAGNAVAVTAMRVFTRSRPARSRLHLELHAGRRTAAKTIGVSGYNAVVRRVLAGVGTRVTATQVRVGAGRQAAFEIELDHMTPVHPYAHDGAHVRFDLGRDAFTIALTSLDAEGPIWFADAGIFIVRADHPETFAAYRERTKGRRNVAAEIAALPEQSLAGAMNGQPRPHPMPYVCGCRHARQKFWIEPCGDIELTDWLVNPTWFRSPAGSDTPKWKNAGTARVFFGFDQWAAEARHNDPWPVMAYNLQFRRDAVRVRQKCFAVPLTQSILAGEPAPDATIVALVRFSFENTGDTPATAELPIAYSHHASRVHNRREMRNHNRTGVTDTMIPVCEREKLILDGDLIRGSYKDEMVPRLAFQTEMTSETHADGVRFRKELQPGETCEFLARVPFVAVESEAELAALRGLDFDRCHDEMARYWRAESRKGAQISTPDPHLNAVYTGHLPMVVMSDYGHADDPRIVSTSVGACTYGNFTNESVMIVEELQQRGMTEDVRRRLATWVKYQGTVGLNGRFTDHDGVFYGSGGWEQGQSYNQHHGWALWALARHFLHTGDHTWFAGVADSVIKGAEWIARQRRETMKELPHSRGWERGFLPAGALEDVEDYFYWLSTNSLTWRGLDSAAAALENYGHAEAKRYRREADAYGRDLRRGFEAARRHSPLVRLRDGRWVPHYPSRLYCRGRDYGWIRETLEGSVYLLISGLYKSESKQGGWILDDYQDTRYMCAPYSYPIHDPQTEWFDCGGICPQPTLLAGLLPHLDRDEIEVYLWMFFNAWAACYRPEAQAFVEHPQPVLGFGNCAPFKTSDQSNAMKWLAYMFAYQRDGLLHIGRAIPRAWFAQERPFGAARLSTDFGTVSVEYRPKPSESRIEAEVDLELRTAPDTILLRFRHPEKKPIRSVEVNGRAHGKFDAASGDIELPAKSGRLVVLVAYGE
ncbi:MAG: hypothetical protein FJ225_09570 [Lentisphaerae bacterium]|nr:hypothetical protein [Lentisphaerota bacterium]